MANKKELNKKKKIEALKKKAKSIKTSNSTGDAHVEKQQVNRYKSMKGSVNNNYGTALNPNNPVVNLGTFSALSKKRK